MNGAEVDPFLMTMHYYEKSGLKKTSSKFRKLISIYILLPLLLTMYTMMMVNFRFMNHSILETAEVFESVATFSHVLARKVIFLKNRHLFEELIICQKKFWSYDTCGRVHGDKFRAQNAWCVSIVKFFVVVSLSASACYCAMPLFVDKPLPHTCWIPGNNTAIRIIIYGLEAIFYVESVFIISIFDVTFLYLCLHLSFQFQLIKMIVKSIKFDNTEDHEDICMAKLKKCSNYHRFLLMVHKKLNLAYSDFFVCQYLLLILAYCIQFFLLNDEGVNNKEMLVNVLHVVGLTFLSGFSIIPASNVEAEADGLADTIFGIDWYNIENLKNRKVILFMLMKAQEPLRMSGRGLFHLNRNQFIQSPRVAFSISTILK